VSRAAITNCIKRRNLLKKIWKINVKSND
jgi:hypothetical protein